MGRGPAQLASCGDNGLRVWNGDGSAIPPPSAPARPMAIPVSEAFSSVRWFPSGKLLAAAARNGSVALYLQDTLAFLSALRPPEVSPAAVSSVDVSSGSRFVAVGSAVGNLSVWDMKTRSVEFSVADPLGVPVVSVSIQRTAESRYLACACGSTVSLYSRASKRLVNRFSVEGAEFVALAFSPHKVNVLVAADNSGCVTAWDITKLKPNASNLHAAGVLARFPSQSLAPASDIAFCPSPTSPFSFCVGCCDKRVRFFTLDSPKRELFSIPCPAPVTAVAFSPDSSSIAVGTASGDILMFELAPSQDQSSVAHRQIAKIQGAHASSPNIPASSASVRALHFRPGPGAASPSGSSPRSRVDKGLTGTPVAGTRIVAVEDSASKPSNTAASTPAYARRDSDIFSPVRSAPRPRVPTESESRSVAEVDDDWQSPFEPSSGKSTRELQTPSTSDAGAFFSPLPPSAADCGLQEDSSKSSSRRVTNFIPGRRTEVVGDGAFVTEEDVAEEKSEEDPFGDDDPEVEPVAAPKGRGFNIFGSASLLNESFAAREIAADLRESRGPPERSAVSELSSGRQGGDRRASRSASDVRHRLPPLPPRSLSDDAMPSHKRAEPARHATNVSVDMPRNENDCAESATHSEVVSPGAHSPKSEALDGRETDKQSFDQTGSEDHGSLANCVVPAVSEDSLRKVVAEEVAVAISDLRNDVKNLHTELVLAFSRQEDAFRHVVEDKDKRLLELERHVKQLRLENRQLRGKGRKETLPVPSWM